MEKNLIKSLNKIEKETGVKVYVFSDGKPVLEDEKIPFNYSFIGSEITTDVPTTKIRLGNKTGIILGEGEKEKAYASFIKNLVKISDEEKSDVVKILEGQCVEEEVSQYCSKHALTNDEVCVYLILNKTTDRQNEIIEFLKGFASNEKDIIFSDNEKTVYVKFFDVESKKAYSSPKEYGESIKTLLFNELGQNVSVYVGNVCANFKRVSEAYLTAKSTREVATALGLINGVYEYRDFLSVFILKELTEKQRQKYVEMLLTESLKNVLNDEELLKTAEAFIENGLNRSETARDIYVHRNTLSYRLDKIYFQTGLNLRRFEDAVKFKVATYLYRLF